MKLSPPRLLHLCVTLLMICARPASGQTKGDVRSQSHAPIPGSSAVPLDPARFMEERLAAAQRRGQINELLQKTKQDPNFLEKVQGDPSQLPVTIEQLQTLLESLPDKRFQFSDDDPLFRQLRDLAENHMNSSSRRYGDAKVGKLLELAKKIGAITSPVKPGSSHKPGSFTRPLDSGASSKVDAAGRATNQSPPGRMPEKPAPLGGSPQQPGVGSDANQFLLDSATWLMEHSGSLRNSPAFQQAVENLTQLGSRIVDLRLGSGESSVAEKLADKVSSLLPSQQFWREKVWPKISNLPLPSMPDIKWPNIDFSRTPQPSFDVSRVRLPAPSLGELGKGLLVFVGLALLGVAGWRLYRFQQGRPRRRLFSWKLSESDGKRTLTAGGLSTISCAEDLVRAFEYLSLVKLGPEVQSCHHLAIAERLGGPQGERRYAAVRLAKLYERARYAPETEALPEQALQAARHELSYLAEGDGQ
jgi:hypothetical protein